MKRALFLRCFIFILSVCLGIFIASAFSYNRYLEKNFVPNGENCDYAKGIPLDKMDRKKLITRYDDVIFQALSVSRSEVVKLDKPLNLYQEPDEDTEVAMILPAGEYFLSRNSCDFGQGCRSLPTYKKGWRYFIPPMQLVESDGKGNEERKNFSDWYYIKLEDLERLQAKYVLQQLNRLFELWIERDPTNYTFSRLVKYHDFTILFPFHPSYIKNIMGSVELLAIDRIMFENGDYLSPDLFKPLWDWKCTALSIGIVLLLIPERLLARRENRKSALSTI